MKFCGRVLMFLAAIYPISEKSAVNLAGKVNVANVTAYEDEETFMNAMKGNAAVGSVPVSAVSTTSTPASMDIERSEKKGAMEEGEEGENSDPHSFELYKSFWELQVSKKFCLT